MRVFLNAGHDIYRDSGAIGFGIRECDYAKKITDLLEMYLQQAGIIIDQSLQDDSLSKVVERANFHDSDLFISIHLNASNNTQANGVETLVYNTNDNYTKTLANCINSQIEKSLDLYNRGVKERKDLYVLRKTNMKAILIECAFISNEKDNEKIRKKYDDFARAIARGITDFQLLKIDKN